MPTPAAESKAAVESRITDIRAMLDTAEDAEQFVREHETCTRYIVIDPILWALGWETWNPQVVRVEYPRGKLGRGRVDYALLGEDGNPVILIEAKTWGADLDEKKTREQIGSYFRGLRYGVGCLTDGWEWHVYDLSRPGRITSKRVARIDIRAGRGVMAAATLNKWLRKARWQ